MPWLALLKIHPDIYYDATWVWVPPGIDGIEFIIVIPPDSPSGPDEGLEQQIEVSDPEMQSFCDLGRPARRAARPVGGISR